MGTFDVTVGLDMPDGTFAMATADRRQMVFAGASGRFEELLIMLSLMNPPWHANRRVLKDADGRPAIILDGNGRNIILRDEIPETAVVACVGRRLGDVVRHERLIEDAVIVSAKLFGGMTSIETADVAVASYYS